MHYYLADREAARRHPGARALLLDAAGRVTETSTANIVVCQDGALSTPPLARVLPGVSLAAVQEFAERVGIEFGYADLTPADVAAADEVLLTSTPWCLLPVCTFNGRPIGAGQPGDTYRRLLACWNESAGLDIAEQARSFARRGIAETDR
jgi:branched-subunit amino acid aminotransferase/4-amino-4-deoxychorismate lyase